MSFERLPLKWDEDAPCPVPPELVVEIISPGQSFGALTEKATDYLKAGVDRVWVVDRQSVSLTSFTPDALPWTLKGEEPTHDPLLPGLSFPVADLFRGSSIG